MAAVKKVVITYISRAEVEVYGIDADATAEELRDFIMNDPALRASVLDQRAKKLTEDSIWVEHVAFI
jgi:hypothetical protein